MQTQLIQHLQFVFILPVIIIGWVEMKIDWLIESLLYMFVSLFTSSFMDRTEQLRSEEHPVR